MCKNGILCLFLLVSFNVFCQRNNSENKNELAPEITVQSMAVERYQAFLAKNIVIELTPDVELVQKVGNRVIEALKKYYAQKKRSEELKDFHWEIKMVDKKDINVWCIPGGKMIVCSGLTGFTQNEASLAVTFTHQIAHVLMKHGNERLKKSLQEFMGGKTLPEALAAKPADTRDLFEMAYGMGNHIGVTPPYNIKNEMEADKLGLMLTGLAGYNPREALVIWERMSQLSRTARKPELLGLHQVSEERMEEMEKIMDDMVKNFYKPPHKT